MESASSSMQACRECLASILARDSRDWRPFASPRILPSNVVVGPVVSNRASAFASGHLAEHQSLAPRRPPEMLDADLAPLLLELALWGTANPAELSWLTPPPPGAVAQARELLTGLGALNAEGQITAHGRQMAELPLHPRLAHMLLKSVPLQLTGLACEIAALLSERDILRGPSGWRNADLRLRLDVLDGQHDHAASATVDRAACQRVRRTADSVATTTSAIFSFESAERASMRSVACSHSPIRIASPNANEELMRAISWPMVVAPSLRILIRLVQKTIWSLPTLDGGTQWARIDLAAPVQLHDLETLYEDQIQVVDEVSWDETAQVVRATRQRRLSSLILSEQGLSKPDPSIFRLRYYRAFVRPDSTSWPGPPELRQWRARVAFLRRIEGQESRWPDLSDEALLRTLDDWLGPYLAGLTTLDRVTRLDLTQPLHALLSWEQSRQLERLAPTHLTVPSGSNVRVEYETPDLPILAVRLQEMFGCKDTPHLVDGKIPVMVHLLSPSRRPVQITKDLSSFWKSAYHRSEERTPWPLPQTFMA